MKAFAQAGVRRINGAAEIVRDIFDGDYYLRQYPDVAEAGVDPLEHFLGIGWAEGRNPSALFDTELYFDRNPDVLHAGLNPLVHYVRAGAREGRQVSLLFDAQWYLAKNPDVAQTRVNPLWHYLKHGAAEGREANPLFDQAWYLKRYPEAAREAPCPLAHYAEHGYARRLSPHPLFDGAFYLDTHADVAEAGMNPLAHFLLRGHEETRQPHPLFDAEWYLSEYPDVAAAGINPLLHYIWEGAKEGRNPNPEFDTVWYLNTYADVAERGVNPLVDYSENRQRFPRAKRVAPPLDGPEKRPNGARNSLHARAIPPVPMDVLTAARDVAQQQNSVAVVCWDGGHNPIGRAKVLYDALIKAGRPAVLLAYMFPEFGERLWAPLRDSGLQFVGIPWCQREVYHTLFSDLGIRFDTVWICKSRLPSFLLAQRICHPDTKLILDLDDNEEHFAKSPNATTKPYGLPGIGLSRRFTENIAARTVASRTLQKDFGGIIMRHARERGQTSVTVGWERNDEIKIGFLGTVRPHKNIEAAADAVRLFRAKSGKRVVFHVYGDVAPDSLRRRLREAGAVIHGIVPTDGVDAIVRDCAVMITGFPSRVADDAEITKYQITAKIGDSLAAGRPVLVPDTPSVRDLRDVNGLYLFDEETFADALHGALSHVTPISLPEEFTVECAARSFLEAEKVSEKALRAREVFPELRSAPTSSTSRPGRENLVLIWKQHDAGIYGRRIDQIARSYKRARPDARVIVLELLHERTLASYRERMLDWTSDFAIISNLAKVKSRAGHIDGDGVEYRSILFELDRHLHAEFIQLLAREGLTPANTVVGVFPIVRQLDLIWETLKPFPMFVDFVDNQFAWASEQDHANYRAQYAKLAAAARHAVFNSARNREFFEAEDFLPKNQTVSVIPNWYVLPRSLVGTPLPPKSDKPSVVYTGNMNDRIDWTLVEAVANLDVHVNLVGNAHRASSHFWRLLEHPNVAFHGPLDEAAAVLVAAKSHVAIMPHSRDGFSNFMNPLKLSMYAALGLPAVSTQVEGLLDHELIQVATDESTFLQLTLRHLYGGGRKVESAIPAPIVPLSAEHYLAVVDNTRGHRPPEHALSRCQA